MRSKEDAQDYRYFPEPDLVPIVINDEWIAEIKARQPELRTEKLERYKKEFGLPDYDAEIITGHKKFADLFEATTEICNKPKKVSNWIMGEIIRLLKENEMDPEDIQFSPVNLAKALIWQIPVQSTAQLQRKCLRKFSNMILILTNTLRKKD